MDLSTALAWAATRHHGVLVTLRRDGRAQTSDVAYAIVDGRFHISLTADRAKTANMRRDTRVVIHLTDPAEYSYMSFDCTAELSDVATDPNDPIVDELKDLYRLVSGGEHPDWKEYRAAMVADLRCVARITPHSAIGQINR